MLGQSENFAEIISHDIIVAPTTAKGRSAIAGIRISGLNSIEFTRRYLMLNISCLEANTAQVTKFNIEYNSHLIADKAVIIIYRAPKSYTGEDMVELFVHGNPLLVETLVKFMISKGARLAHPGEFTMRGLLNGKMDLLDAESVSAVIEARTLRSISAVKRITSVNRELKSIYEKIREILVEITAVLEFPEDVITHVDVKEWLNKLSKIYDYLDDFMCRARNSKALTTGLTIAIAGPPNVGKSTLFNRIIGSERAIVTPHPGTTRDIIEAIVELEGVPVKLLDTAGLRKSEHPIENEGIMRAQTAIENADLLLWVIDSSVQLPVSIPKHQNSLIVINKVDLEISDEILKKISDSPKISALTGEGLPMLLELVSHKVINVPLNALIVSIRTQNFVSKSKESLENCIDALSKEYVDVAQVMLEKADMLMSQLFEPIGCVDIYEEVFSRFCVGK